MPMPPTKRMTTRITEVRSLTEADLQYLQQPSARRRIDNLRDSHHMVARYLAIGMKQTEVAERTGYSIVRIGQLAVAPSVQELIAKYQSKIDDKFLTSVDEVARLAVANTLKAERMLSDKLDDADANDETLPTRELVAITSDRMDRFGWGKRSTNLNINVDFAKQLEAAIARTKKVSAA